jgi:hypothetical protein
VKRTTTRCGTHEPLDGSTGAEPETSRLEPNPPGPATACKRLAPQGDTDAEIAAPPWMDRIVHRMPTCIHLECEWKRGAIGWVRTGVARRVRHVGLTSAFSWKRLREARDLPLPRRGALGANPLGCCDCALLEE